MRKIMALTLMLMMLVGTVCYAAVSSSGSKSSSSPKSSTSVPSSSKTAAPSGSYQPTAPANSYSNTAPAKQTTPGVSNTQPQSSSGGFWRSASMFGGGMLAGSLLGNMFGNNNMGGESSIFGMLLNILMIGGVVMAIRYLWSKYKNKNREM